MNILIFHKIVKRNISNWADIKTDLIENTLEKISESGKSVSSIINSGPDSNSIIFTFDDGHKSDFEIVFPLLKKYNYTATFFIVPEKIGMIGYMTWEDIHTLHRHGMEIGSHSLSHRYMSSLSEDALEKEFVESKKILEKRLNTQIVSFAYPYGDFSRTTNKIAKGAGYKYICTSKPGNSSKEKSILNRNSLHSKMNQSDVNKIIFNNSKYFFSRLLKYSMLRFLKTIIGIEKYLKLKKKIYSK